MKIRNSLIRTTTDNIARILEQLQEPDVTADMDLMTELCNTMLKFLNVVAEPGKADYVEQIDRVCGAVECERNKPLGSKHICTGGAERYGRCDHRWVKEDQ